MKKPISMLWFLGLAMLFTQATYAQDSTFFKGRWYKPMPFPTAKPAMTPDENTQVRAIVHRKGFPDTLLAPAPADAPEAAQMQGLPGVDLDVKQDEINLQESFTSLSLVNNLTSFPFRAVVKIFMTYPSGNTFVCSGALIDSRHVLTAGHCAHSQAEGGWADEMTVFPAYDAAPDPTYGGSSMVYMTSWTGWTLNESWEHDMALVELDRPVGALTGWLGYGYNSDNTFYTNNTFHNPGYPANAPYNGQYMYYWYGDYDYVHSSNNILYHYNQAFGGQSGSNAYYKDANDNRYVHAVLSHGNSSQTGHTRITSAKYSDISGIIQGEIPSANDLIPLKTFASPQSIEAGANFSEFKFLVHNYSSSSFSGSISVSFYLSTNDYISTGDDLLTTRNFSGVTISPRGTASFAITGTPIQLPAGTTPDDYFVGVILNISDADTGNNNTVEYDTYPITVVCGTPAAPSISASGSTTLCPGQNVSLSATNVCSGCTVTWSNGQTGNSISVASSGTYTARNENGCGNQSSGSNSVSVTSLAGPTTPTISASGSTILCNGQNVTLTATNVCSGCTVTWSNGQTGNSLTVGSAGTFTARYSNTCGQGAVSNSISTTNGAAPSAPNVSAGGSTSLCSGQTVTLTAANVCSGCTVTWSNGQTGANLTVSTPGSYTATNTNNCGTSTASNAIAVTTGTAPAAPTVSASGPTSLCSGQTVTLTAANVCSNCTVNWSNGQTGASLTVSTPGSYTATNTNNCGTSTASNAIAVTTGTPPAAPSVSASGPTSLCSGQTVTLTAANVCSNCTVNWSNGQTGNSITVSTPGNYAAANTNNCGTSSGSNTISITTGTAPAPPAISTSGATSLCNGQSVVLNAANICNDCTVTWSNGQTGNSLTVSAPGNYTATNTNNCGTSPLSNTIVLTAGTAPVAPVVTALGATIICPGQSVTLRATSSCTDCITTWSNGQPGTDLAVTMPGVYSATQTNACGTSPASGAITIIGGVAPTTPIIAAAGATTLCNGQSVTLNATNICPGCTVTWSNGQSGASTTVTQPGTYTANYSNACGAGANSNTVNVTQGGAFTPVVQINNTCYLAAPNGSGFQWYMNGAVIPGANAQFLVAPATGYFVVSMNNPAGCSGVSDPVFALACATGTTEALEGISMQLYPNPASDRVYVSISNDNGSQPAHIELYGTDGRMLGILFEGVIPPGNQVLELALPYVPTGLYRYRFVTEKGSSIGNIVIAR